MFGIGQPVYHVFVDNYYDFDFLGSEIWHPDCSDEYQREIEVIFLHSFSC